MAEKSMLATPVIKLYGVGKVRAEKYAKMGIDTYPAGEWLLDNFYIIEAMLFKKEVFSHGNHISSSQETEK